MSQAATLEFADAFQRGQRGLAALVFTDIAGSTSLKQHLGDGATAELFRQHHEQVRSIVAQVPGAEEIETSGDSFFLVFAAPSSAVQFSTELRKANQELSAKAGVKIEDRIGIHLGEVFLKSNSGTNRSGLFGISVDTCARVMGLAKPGQVLMTRPVFDNARQAFKGSGEALTWLNHGAFLLKGIEEPVEICEVRPPGESTLSPPTGSEKAQRLSVEGDVVLGWRPAIDQHVPNTRWVLVEKLGEGGFGEVWLAQHEKLKEQRVFKFCFKADRVRALKREMTLFRVLKERVGEHPNLVRIYDVYLEEAPYYLEMEYVEGHDLKSWVEKNGRLHEIREKTKIEIVAQIADALSAAHQAGILHRDIKPGNILIGSGRRKEALTFQALLTPNSSEPPSVGCYDVEAKLTDFGIGQVLSREYLAGMTQAGFTQTIMGSSSSQTGTQMYMAPELLAGKPATPQSDIYSLGVVLYQLLANDFSRPITTDWDRHIFDPALREDLKRCFAGDPADRFANASALATSLRAISERRLALERQQAELLAREKAGYRKGLIRAGALAALVILLVGSFCVLAFRTAQDRREHLYVADINVAAQAVQQYEMGRARAVLAKYLSRQFWERDLRSWEWRYLWQRCQPNFERSFEDQDIVSCAVFSPDAKWLATVGKTVQIRELAGARRLHTLTFDHPVVAKGVDFSPNGKLLAVKSRGQVRVFSTDTWKEAAPILAAEATGDINDAVAFAPDGTTLAARVSNGMVGFWETTSWERTATALPASHISTPDYRSDAALGTVICYSADGRYLALADWYAMQIRDARTPATLLMNLQRSDGNKSMRILSIAFSERFVAAGFRDGNVTLWQTGSWKEMSSMKLHQSWINGLAFSPDGALLAAASTDHVIQLWDVGTLIQGTAGDKAIRPAHSLQGHSRTVYSISFSKDGKALASASGDRSAKIWATPGRAERSIPERAIAPIWFSPDGGTLVVREESGELWRWDVPARRRVEPFGPPPIGTNLAFEVISPDGARLARALDKGEIEIWNVPERSLERKRAGNGERVRAALFSPGRFSTLAVIHNNGDNTVLILWNLSAGTEERIHPPNGQSFSPALQFSGDGRFLAVPCGHGVGTIDPQTGKLRLIGEGPLRFWQAAFSPDGTLLAGSTRESIELWRFPAGEKLASIPLPTENNGRLLFSSDGQTLITADYDNTARFWSVRLANQLMSLPNVRTDFLLSRDGNSLVLHTSGTLHSPGRIELWTVPSLEEIDRRNQ